MTQGPIAVASFYEITVKLSFIVHKLDWYVFEIDDIFFTDVRFNSLNSPITDKTLVLEGNVPAYANTLRQLTAGITPNSTEIQNNHITHIEAEMVTVGHGKDSNPAAGCTPPVDESFQS